jgi:hypothetical protein
MLPSPTPIHLRVRGISREEENSRIDADNGVMRDVLRGIKSEVERSNRLLSRLRGEPQD